MTVDWATKPFWIDLLVLIQSPNGWKIESNSKQQTPNVKQNHNKLTMKLDRITSNHHLAWGPEKKTNFKNMAIHIDRAKSVEQNNNRMIFICEKMCRIFRQICFYLSKKHWPSPVPRRMSIKIILLRLSFVHHQKNNDEWYVIYSHTKRYTVQFKWCWNVLKLKCEEHPSSA